MIGFFVLIFGCTLTFAGYETGKMDGIFGGVPMILVSLAVMASQINDKAVRWLGKHRALLTDAEKEHSLSWRIAYWIVGPKDRLYLWPGGRLGAPYARALTIFAFALGGVAFTTTLIVVTLQKLSP